MLNLQYIHYLYGVMNIEKFTYWLDGFIEGRDNLSEDKLTIVREKLNETLSNTELYATAYPTWYTTQTTTNDKT